MRYPHTATFSFFRATVKRRIFFFERNSNGENISQYAGPALESLAFHNFLLCVVCESQSSLLRGLCIVLWCWFSNCIGEIDYFWKILILAVKLLKGRDVKKHTSLGREWEQKWEKMAWLISDLKYSYIFLRLINFLCVDSQSQTSSRSDQPWDHGVNFNVSIITWESALSAMTFNRCIQTFFLKSNTRQ